MPRTTLERICNESRMQRPSLSILIPTYTRSAMLRETLDSILAQTILPEGLDVVVSNDCSKDDTREVLDGYAARMPYLRVFHQEANLRHAKNWEFLLKQARGELVFLLCDDDAIAPDFLETYLDRFAADPTLDMVLGGIELRGPDFAPLKPLAVETPAGVTDGPSRCLAQLRSHHMVMSTVYRLSTLLDAGGWDAQVGSHLDCNAFCRAAIRARRVEFIPRPMLYFRISEGSWSHTLSTQNQEQLATWYRRKLDLLREDAAKLAPEILPGLEEASRQHVRAVLGYLEIELAKGRLGGKATRSAIRGLMRAFPEQANDSLAWKVRAATVVGTGWLQVLRKVTGRPDPYASDLALFNSFMTPKPKATAGAARS